MTAGVDLAPGTYTWSDLRAHAERVLSGAGLERSPTEARWLVERVADGEAPGDAPAPARCVGRLVEMLERRVAGEPLQHVLGRWAFRHLELLVDRRALVPRPETEVVAEVALEEAERLGLRRGRPDPWADTPTTATAVDLGTGTGALALALVDELSEVAVWATDASGDALSLARANLSSVGLAATRVRLAQGEWFEALPGELAGGVQVIVSNPPYVAEHEVASLPPEVRDHEPRRALVGGPRGTEALERIVAEAPGWLAPGGTLVCELAPHQAAGMAERARACGFPEVLVRPDLAGRDRVLVARRRGPS